MAEDSELEKTEPASQKRLDEAREQGNVPRSRELATCSVLLVAGCALWMLGGRLTAQLGSLLANSLSFERGQAFDMDLLVSRAASLLIDVLLAFAPVAAALMLVAVGAPLLIGGWNFSSKAFMPNFGKLNPLSGLGNLVSSNALVELGKAIGKTILVGIVAWIVLRGEQDAVMALALEPLNVGSAHLGQLLLQSFMLIVAALVAIAAIDVPYQLWHHASQLKMTREELRQEAKESEGNPEIKAKIRATQREMARRRMMSEIPTADVVVTNPTHFAVALKYTDGKMRAPKVVAKGADEVAAKIRELAAEHHVPLLEAPPLARALFRHAELGDEIPEALYTAVAEVLAYVFQLKAHASHGGLRPTPPTALEVPPGMDPLEQDQKE
ncbi:flagellar biosynthesis protein FlhB [Noviherbaspirillum soli]|uniref:flagellar biosynthesis protein FlhB n=1 Tax=Noviherbaspirillum soli TaxID=1064518 RepID=UPI00188C3AC3|nr:flagellar biosynthesis protein FlhB [Noviherbaspirillum soli]